MNRERGVVVTDAVVKKNNLYWADSECVTEGSLLESLLFLMTDQQCEYFLNKSLSDDIVYANKIPTFESHMCMVLTKTAYEKLLGLYDEMGTPYKSLLDDSAHSMTPIDILKSELEAGVQLRIPSGGWNYDRNKDNSQDLKVDIITRRLIFACRLKNHGDNAAFLLATHVKNSAYFIKKPENADRTSGNLSGVEETVNTGFIDLSKSVLQPEKTNPRAYNPHFKTAWNLYQFYRDDIKSFSLDDFEGIIWQIANKNILAQIGYRRRKYLEELEKVVNLSQLAMQFPYTAVSAPSSSKDHASEYRICNLKVHGPGDEVAKISWAYIYTDEKPQENQHKSRFQRMSELLKRRLKRIAVLELEGYNNGHHVFKIHGDQVIPHEGYLVDVGSESQIVKQIEAIHFLGNPKNRPHLLKLNSLLGRVDFVRFDDFGWKENTPVMFDRLLTSCQVEAVSKAINTPDICLIQGPPGTGKTRVISEIIQQASRKRWKTLLVAPTHVAVDNVLEQIGYNDNISPIRCANKNKIADLPEHIQQFTYLNRRGSLVNRSQDKIKQDIERLGREKVNLDKAIISLKKLELLFNSVKRLRSEEQSLIKKIDLVEKNVQADFEEELEGIKINLKEQSKQLKHTKRKLGDSQKDRMSLDDKLSRFISGSYTKQDKLRFKASQHIVDGTQGEIYKEFKTKLANAKKRKGYFKNKIILTEEKFQSDNEILILLNSGKVPHGVDMAIEAAVVAIETKHDRNIESKKNTLKRTQDSLHDKELGHERLVELLEKITVKQQKLAKQQQKSFLYKTLSLLWWQSKLIDLDARRLQYSLKLRESKSSTLSFKSEIEEIQREIEDSQIAKKKAMKEIRKNELARQHDKYRKEYKLLEKKLKDYNVQLHAVDSEILMLTGKTECAKQSYEDASQKALEHTKEDIEHELHAACGEASEVELICKREFDHCDEMHAEYQSDYDLMQDRINQAVLHKQNQINSKIDKLNKDVKVINLEIESIWENVSSLVGYNVSEQPSSVPKILDEITMKIVENTNKNDFCDSWLDCLINNSDEISYRMSKYTNLICATTVGIASDEYFGDGSPLEQKQFDLLIIDEAGKVTESEFLVAASRAKKWVIVGDHKQLPPYYDRKLDDVFDGVNQLRSRKGLPPFDPSVLQVSYFENLWNQLSSVMAGPVKLKSRLVTLDIQRRMHPDLAEFIADMFYPGHYNSPQDPEFTEKKTLDLLNFNYAITFIEVSPSKGVRGLETNLRLKQNDLGLLCKAGYANLPEAKKVIEVLKSLLFDEAVSVEQRELCNNNDSAATIGIISFYAAQVELIKKLIRGNVDFEIEEQSQNGRFICKGFINVIVNTVDSFQGKECSIVILSFTRSNPYNNIGFVDDANRLNVAMSRARKKLILLGDTKTFIRRAHNDEKCINNNDTNSVRAERAFFEKLVQYIDGRGEIKKAFHVWGANDVTP